MCVYREMRKSYSDGCKTRADFVHRNCDSRARTRGKGGGGVLPPISYIGVCGAKGYGF